MSNWIELNEQWQQRSEQLFQRCVREPDIVKAEGVWDAACQSEESRLEWQSWCLRQQGEVVDAITTEAKRAFFRLDNCPEIAQ